MYVRVCVIFIRTSFPAGLSHRRKSQRCMLEVCAQTISTKSQQQKYLNEVQRSNTEQRATFKLPVVDGRRRKKNILEYKVDQTKAWLDR